MCTQKRTQKKTGIRRREEKMSSVVAPPPDKTAPTTPPATTPEVPQPQPQKDTLKQLLLDMQRDVVLFTTLEDPMRQFDRGSDSQRALNLKVLSEKMETYAPPKKNDVVSFRSKWINYAKENRDIALKLLNAFNKFELDSKSSSKHVDIIRTQIGIVRDARKEAQDKAMRRRGRPGDPSPPPEYNTTTMRDLLKQLANDARLSITLTESTTVDGSLIDRVILDANKKIDELSKKNEATTLDAFLANEDTLRHEREKLTLKGLYTVLGKDLIEEMKKCMITLSKDPTMIQGMYSSSVKEVLDNMKTLVDDNNGLMEGINEAVPALSSLKSGLTNLNSTMFSSSGMGLGMSGMSSFSSPNSNIPMPPFAGNLLYRTVDPIRVNKYLAQLERFDTTYEGTSLQTSVKTQGSRLSNIRTELKKRAGVIKDRQTEAKDEPDMSYAVQAGKLKQVRKQHFEACKSHVRAVRNLVSIYVTKHLNFVRYHHGDAIAYMNYWANASSGTSGMTAETLELIKKHQAKCKDISDDAKKRINDDVIKVTQSILYAPDAVEGIVLDQDDQYVIYELSMNFTEWAQGQIGRVEEAFLTGPPSTIEEFMEPHQIILYSLKLLRVGIAAIAIAAAERIFQSVYRKRVYVYDEDPPNLAWFLGTVLLIDLAIHAIVALVLVIIMHIFARGDNTFPVNRDLMRMWVFDYFVATVPVALILLSTATVLRFKKYFRYKYEGQRAIRAMAKITFYTYAVVLPIPFYRMTYG